jgi:serine/threonine protein phosphatase PrpC
LREQKQAERAAKELADRQANLALAEEQAARSLREREQELSAREQKLSAELTLASQLRESLQQQQVLQQLQLQQQPAPAPQQQPAAEPDLHDEAAEMRRLFQLATSAYNARAPTASLFVDSSGAPAPQALPRVAFASARGRRAKMEDAIAVLKSPLTLALFDGHGGPDAAVMCASGLSTFLRASLVGRSDDIPSVLRLTYSRLQNWLSTQQSPSMAEVGTTATVVMQSASDGAWHVAQAGDARAVLFEFAFAMVERSTWSGVNAAVSPSLDDLRTSSARARAELARAADFKAEPRNIGVGGAMVRAQELAPCHRPSVESERKRVEERGGAILRNRVCGVLAVTRALGDTALDPYLSHTPELRGPFNWDGVGASEFEYRSALVIGCDGAWDVLSVEAVAQHVIAATLGDSDGAVDVSKSDVESSVVIGAPDADDRRPSDARSVQLRPLAAAERIRDAAVRAGSADNVSVVVAALPVAAPVASQLPLYEPVIVPHVVSAPVAVAKPHDVDSVARQASSGSGQQLSPPSPSSSAAASVSSEMSKRERRLLAAEAARHRARQQSSEGTDAAAAALSAESTPETRRRARAATSSDALRSSNSNDERRATLDDLDLARRELAAEREADRQRIAAERAKQRRRAADVRRIVANYAAQKEARQSAEAAALADKEHARRRRAAATFGAEWDAKSVPSAVPTVPDEPLVLSLSADENAIVAYLRDPQTGVGAQRVQRGEERVFTGSELVDWLLQHIDATPPVTPPQTPPRFGSGLLPVLDDNDAPSFNQGAMGGIAGVRRSDAFAFAQRLVAIGVVRVLHDAALAAPSSAGTSVNGARAVVPVGELRDSLTVTLALCDDFAPTIVLRENPATELVDSGNGVTMTFPTRVPRRRPDWLDDKCTNACMQCQAAFRMTLRRHHCRSCGFIVCGRCAKRKIALPHLGYATRQLCCERCIAAFYSSGAKVVVNGVVAVAPAAEGGRRSRRNTSEVTVPAATTIASASSSANASTADNAQPPQHGSIESLPVSFGGTDRAARQRAVIARSRGSSGNLNLNQQQQQFEQQQQQQHQDNHKRLKRKKKKKSEFVASLSMNLGAQIFFFFLFFFFFPFI